MVLGMRKNSEDKKRMGHFEREAKLNLIFWILLVLAGLLAAYVFPYIIKLLKK
jgi:hypothetical protein